MRIAIYTRVSTLDQDVENQLIELRAWADSHGHAVVAEYQDVASGARRREHLDDLLMRRVVGSLTWWPFGAWTGLPGKGRCKRSCTFRG